MSGESFRNLSGTAGTLPVSKLICFETVFLIPRLKRKFLIRDIGEISGAAAHDVAL